MSDSVGYDYLFKLIVIGSSGVGKSNILSKFTKNLFNLEAAPTLGVEFLTKNIKIKQKNARLQLWDTAGQEKFQAITSQYYRGAHGALLVYDITNQDSFNDVETWYTELRANAKPDLVVVLVGNKSDLEVARKISFDEGKNLASKYNLYFMETSAKSGLNVDEAFENVAV